MSRSVLITGGAGFIGSHLADALLTRGDRVRVLDNLSPQVHGGDVQRPEYLSSEVELQVGDVRDESAVRRALDGIEVVYHLAAMVGVGQSMYQVRDYAAVNGVGTAVLLEALIERPVERLVVASSMSIYGEGLYRAAGGVVAGRERPLEQLRRAEWELRDEAGTVLEPVPTPESKTPSLSSVYALTKYDQERLCLMIGRAYGIPAVALRFFNVYGTRQALSNPYTGVLAIFASRLLNGNAPLIFEDGMQQRDFVSVHDVAQASVLAATSDAAVGRALNIGSGRAWTVREIAQRLARVMGRSDIDAQITGRYRVGDIRHCFADVTASREVLGYTPRIELDDGLRELAGWLEGQAALDRVHQASRELAVRGLTV
jgi:dTDP-L-rhamnose 4-epimerase